MFTSIVENALSAVTEIIAEFQAMSEAVITIITSFSTSASETFTTMRATEEEGFTNFSVNLQDTFTNQVKAPLLKTINELNIEGTIEFQTFQKNIDKVVQAINATMKSAVDAVDSVMREISKMRQDAMNPITYTVYINTIRTTTTESGYAEGGAVEGGQNVIWGERGAEYFQPLYAGRIVPANISRNYIPQQSSSYVNNNTSNRNSNVTINANYAYQNERSVRNDLAMLGMLGRI
jgi:hypothetical protein